MGELNRALADEWFAIYEYWYVSLAPEQIMSPIVMNAIKKDRNRIQLQPE